MQRIVLTFGVISGLISATLMAIAVPLYVSGALDFENGQIIGYSSMVLSFLLIFFGIRSYRENVGGGSITFLKAFLVGILITGISCLFYVVTWLVAYYNYFPNFFDKYSVYVIEKMQREGKSDAEILKTQKQMQDFKKLYRNPLINGLITFMEPFPVGLIVTLISAAILRRKPGAPPAPAHATALA